MVNRATVTDLLYSYFHVEGPVEIQDNGMIHGPNATILDRTSQFPNGMLPVQFGQVHKFHMSGTNLRSMQGFPTSCNILIISHNELDSWAHCPQTYEIRATGNKFRDLNQIPAQVRELRVARCPLENIRDVPDLDFLYVSFDLKLGMLPALKCKKVNLMAPEHVEPPLLRDQLQRILDKYAGQGRKGALTCAAELIRAGFKENARW